MWGRNLSLRIAGPTILVSCLLLVLCVAAAVYLYNEQAVSAKVHGANISSAQVGNTLKTTLTDLVDQLRAGKEDDVGRLHERIGEQLEQARRLADTKKELDLVAKLDAGLQHYFRTWDSRGTDPSAKARAIHVLERDALPVCRELQEVNVEQIQETETALRRTVQWVIAGLIGVCTVGALGGLLLGYGVARTLRRSIHHLSIHVQDAANKLRQDLRPVSLKEDGDLTQLHGQMQNVVREIEQVVEKLQQRERDLLRAEQLAAVGQLAAGVAHELRNPLTSIKMLVQTSREEAQAQGLEAEDLRVIDLEIRRMERCLQTFLDFARPPKPACRRLDLAAAVQRTLDLVGGRARKQQVAVCFTPPAPPVFVAADEEQLQQLLVNLTLNALDVMPRGGRLEIDLRGGRGGDRRQVEVCVQDTGPGIAAEVMPRLFQPFVSGKETGLGLGLVTSRRIAESHGGSLEGHNRPEGGACFVLRLPLAA
jgi:C4-dicarboxylate-specific signal transduction histidine kinase